MGTPSFYAQFKLKQNNGNAVALDTAAVKVMIVSSSYTANLATHAFKSDLTGEVSGTNYTARGTAIAGVTLTASGNNWAWIHNDITWAQNAAGFTNGRSFVWYVDTGVDATSKLIMIQTEAADFGNVAGDLLLDGSAVTGVAGIS